MLGPKINLIASVVGSVAVTAAIGGAYLHYNGILKDRARLQIEVQVLVDADAIQKQTIRTAEVRVNQWQQKYTEAQERLLRYAEVQMQSRQEVNRLRRLFAARDLEEFAREKPEVLERAVNSGSSRINRLLECASGGGVDCSSGTSSATTERDTPSETSSSKSSGRGMEGDSDG